MPQQVNNGWLKNEGRTALEERSEYYHYFNIPRHPPGNVTRHQRWRLTPFSSVSQRRRGETPCLQRLSSLQLSLALTQLRLFAATHSPSPLRTHQSFCETAAEVLDENRLKGGISQQRSGWHGNDRLCARGLLLCASEVSHCPAVRGGLSRLQKFTELGGLYCCFIH